MGYTLACMKALARIGDNVIHAVGWDQRKLSEYVVEKENWITYVPRSSFKNAKELKDWVSRIRPDIIYVSGRMDKTYLIVCRDYLSTGIPVVSGFDNQWFGGVKQHLAVLAAPFLYHRYFSHLWVAGIEQYEYARRLGFKKDQILLNVYSADVERFQKIYHQNLKFGDKKCLKKLLFVGRFSDVKGLDILINAFAKLSEKEKNGWSLTLIGNGPLKDKLVESTKKHNDIEIKGFLQPDRLIEEISQFSAFVLPSRKEAWGVVIHEFAAAGFPLIVSDTCGATTVFLKNGYNGYLFKNGDENNLKIQLKKLFIKDKQVLNMMGIRSFQISNCITPESWAYTLLSTLGYNDFD